MDEWDSLSVNLAFWDMCEYLYRQFSTVWFGPNSGLSRMTLFGQKRTSNNAEVIDALLNLFLRENVVLVCRCVLLVYTQANKNN